MDKAEDSYTRKKPGNSPIERPKAVRPHNASSYCGITNSPPDKVFIHAVQRCRQMKKDLVKSNDAEFLRNSPPAETDKNKKDKREKM